MTEKRKELTRSDFSTQAIQIVQKWGSFAKQAGLVPAQMNVHQAAAIVQAGKEMGLAPLQSLRMMSFVKGRLVMAVQLQLALARKKGVKIKELIDSDTECTVTLVRDDETVTCKYTLEDAKRAGLLRQDSNWQKYPRQMLRWRAIGDALRMIAPDCVMGLLSPEEAENLEPIEPEVIEVKQSPEPAQPKKITQAQLKRLWAIANETGLNAEEAKAIIMQFGFESSKDITQDKYDEIIKEFEKYIKPKEGENVSN